MFQNSLSAGLGDGGLGQVLGGLVGGAGLLADDNNTTLLVGGNTDGLSIPSV